MQTTTMSEGLADDLLKKAQVAAGVFSQYSQEQTDRVVKAVYEAGFNSRVKLAKLAYEETKLGKWQDKVIKNVVATQFVYHDIKDLKTVGIISEDTEKGIIEIAQPMGPILAVIPVTNPTSTVLFKILIAMKTRNPIIISPSPKAKQCSVETARLCYTAAIQADAPEHCIQWLTDPTLDQTQALMRHKSLALILATGGAGLVKAAYSSGTPTLGVGAGNVPVFIEQTADIPFAVEQICASKLFDNGTICASEQAIVVERCIANQVMDQFEQHQAYFLPDAEFKQLEETVFDLERGLVRSDTVGQSAYTIAQKARLAAPPEVQLLIAPLKGIGQAYPLSSEKLSPILAFYTVDDFEHAVKVCIDLNFYGGIGHTVGIYSNDDEKIKQFALMMNAGRIIVNTPSSQGAVGGLFNKLNPSFTLGCGTGGKNITTDNVTAWHLLNIQRIARRRDNLWLQRFDSSKYLDESLDVRDIEKEFYRNG